jgi:antitoxin ParD1/3/4
LPKAQYNATSPIRQALCGINHTRKIPKIYFELIPIFGIFTKTIVMSKNTSITLGSYFDQFIQSILREGRYKNASEVVRAGLRLLEEEEQKIIALRHAIDEGVNSGLAEDFDPEEHLKILKASRR